MYKRQIFDSNLTSLITGVILLITGTGPIRGFATTSVSYTHLFYHFRYLVLCHCRQGTDYRTILKEARDSMMKINKNAQDFVLKYFQQGKLDTRKALQKVKARVGIADEELSLIHIWFLPK